MVVGFPPWHDISPMFPAATLSNQPSPGPGVTLALGSRHQGPQEPQNPLPSSASSASWQSVFLLGVSGLVPSSHGRHCPGPGPMRAASWLSSLVWSLGLPCVAASTLPPVVRDCLKRCLRSCFTPPGPTPNALHKGLPVAFRIKG